MVIEFQMSRLPLEQLLHERIIAARPCILDPLQFLGDSYYVVSIDVGTTKLAIADEEESFALNTILGSGDVGAPLFGSTSVDLKRLQLEQKVDVHVSSEDMLRSANTQPPTVLHVTATIVFDLAVIVTSEGRPRLCATVRDIRDLELPDEDAKDQVIAVLQKELRNCANFGFGALAQMTGGTFPTVINAGIAATANLGRIAIRFDTATPAADAGQAWTSFFAGNFPSLLANQDWALHLPHELIVPPLIAQLKQQLENAEEFNLVGEPSGSWTPLGPIPQIKVSFSGELIDACVGIDVDVDVTTIVILTVPPNSNILRTAVSVSWDGDFWEELLCELLAATFWPVVGAMFIDEGKLKWWEFLLGFVAGPAGVFTATIVYLSTDEPASQIPDPPDWVKDSDTQWHQDMPFPSTIGNFMSGLTLTGTSATGQGLVMVGTIEIVSPRAPELKVAASDFSGWKSERPCYEPFAVSSEAMVAYVAAAPSGPTPQLPQAGSPLAARRDLIERAAAADELRL